MVLLITNSNDMVTPIVCGLVLLALPAVVCKGEAFESGPIVNIKFTSWITYTDPFEGAARH